MGCGQGVPRLLPESWPVSWLRVALDLSSFTIGFASRGEEERQDQLPWGLGGWSAQARVWTTHVPTKPRPHRHR